MRKLALVALLSIVAMPAWAANDTQEADQMAAYGACRAAGNNMHICTIKHAPSEAEAHVEALKSMTFCAAPDLNRYAVKECAETVVYIKARWNY